MSISSFSRLAALLLVGLFWGPIILTAQVCPSSVTAQSSSFNNGSQQSNGQNPLISLIRLNRLANTPSPQQRQFLMMRQQQWLQHQIQLAEARRQPDAQEESESELLDEVKEQEPPNREEAVEDVPELALSADERLRQAIMKLQTADPDVRSRRRR